ncbi:MAG: excinuclease ABC subunit UvrC, partial [Eubacteriaceae bacterium]|nr:excinuclease ABC subunit UvrC [Eubacteriaceae bacterium]
MKTVSDDLAEKLRKLPDDPGVYMHLDSQGNVIYVGKAKNLKNRVRQYFRDRHDDIKTRRLVECIYDTNWIVVDNEVEAFLLECNLIKQYRPYYNILLKDDKSYPYLKLTFGEDYPRLIMTRKRLLDRGRYFGPYSNAGAAKKMLEAINRFYPLKMCTKKVSAGKKTGRVCLNYHLGQCMGPCQGDVDPDIYAGYVKEVEAILSGSYRDLSKKITEAMNEEAEKLNYEAAAELRDMNEAVLAMYEKQKIDSSFTDERDIIAVASDENLSAVQLFRVREGKMIAGETRYMTKSPDDTDSDVYVSFIQQYYISAEYIPREILIYEQTDQEEVLSELLSRIKGSRVTVSVPRIGEKKRLGELAYKNALMNIENKRSEAERAEMIRRRAMTEIAQKLGMESPPKRIESYDISNTAGADNVGVMVVFNESQRSPKDYRRFRIKYVSGQDDYSSMSEVVFRRLNRAYGELQEGSPSPKFLPLPDLILADGGAAHVNTIKSVVSTFGYDITVAGLVKDSKHRLRGVVLE